MNTSLGGLNNAGTPYDGVINLFYSILSILIIPEQIVLVILKPDEYNAGEDLSNTVSFFMMAGVGICNLLMIFAPLFLLLKNYKNQLVSKVMIACALYICIIGTMANYHFYPIRYGHFVWCMSFLIVAGAFFIRANYKDAFS